jgi:hypothetical protein
LLAAADVGRSAQGKGTSIFVKSQPPTSTYGDGLSTKRFDLRGWPPLREGPRGGGDGLKVHVPWIVVVSLLVVQLDLVREPTGSVL